MTRPGSRARRLACVLLCALLALATTGAPAAEIAASTTDQTKLLTEWTAAADQAREVIASEDATDEDLAQLRGRLEAGREEARAMIAAVNDRLRPLDEQLAALGPVPENAPEDPTVAKLRGDLQQRIADARAAQASAQLAETRFSTLLNDLAALNRMRLRELLLLRGPLPLTPGPWLSAATDFARLARDIRAEVAASLDNAAQRSSALSRAPLAALAFFSGIAILVVFRRMVEGWAERQASRPGAPRSVVVTTAIMVTLARLALPATAIALLGFGLQQSGLLGPKLDALMASSGLSLAYLVGAYALTQAFYAPSAPALRLSGLDDLGARRAQRGAMGLAATLAIDTALIAAQPLDLFSRQSLVAINFTLIAFGGCWFWDLRQVYTRAAGQREAPMVAETGDADPDEDARPISAQLGWLLRRGAGLATFAGPALALLGYFAAARMAMYPPIKTAAILGAAALVFAIARDITDSVAVQNGRPEAPRGSALRLIPITTGFALFLAAMPLLALAWGTSVADLRMVGRMLLEGFQIGGVRISPVAFLTFAFVFAIGYVLTRFVQRLLRGTVLPELGVSAAGRSALTAGVGYVGMIGAALIAISATGLDLSNLAILAGALSVGIGFGLQTIVNNFVSGIILLLERPIKIGDWIKVAAVEGTVRKINVRSTEIQTFDRQTYIVPNSDLISSSVINYTHTNLTGRLTVQVGVAYDSDPRQVEKILREVGLAHPLTMRRPGPEVLFRSFGASAIEFELRVFLRDVTQILIVSSDLHYAIFERFRQAGIEIPYSEHNLWLRNIDEVADALRGPRAPSRLPGEKSA